MSGPKGGSYHVETVAQREARMLRDARAQYARAEQEWAAAMVRMSAAAALSGEALDFRRPRRVGSDSTAYLLAAQELSTAAAEAMRLAGDARRRASTAFYANQTAQMVANIDVDEPAQEVARPSRWRATHPVEEASTPATSIDRNRVAERVQKRLNGFAVVDHDASRVSMLIADIAAAGTQSRIDLLMGELDFLLSESRAAADRDVRIQQVRGELSALESRLAEIDSPASAVLTGRITSLIDGSATEIPRDLGPAVEQLIAEADAEADRLYVVQAMTAALHDLGYGAGPEFSTGLSGATATAYARNANSEYGIKLRLESGANRFTVQAVKSDAILTSATEDAQAEREFCTAIDNLIEVTKSRGVLLDLDIRTAPGAHAVQQVDAQKLTAVRRSVGRVQRQQEQRAQ